MEQMIGSQQMLKKSEVMRLITDELYSLGFDEIATRLEQASGITLHSDTAKKFLRQVKDGEWDQSIRTLEGLHLRGGNLRKAAKCLLLTQKLIEFLKIEPFDSAAAYRILNDEITPLGCDTYRLFRMLYDKRHNGRTEDDIASRSRSGVLEELHKIFPPGVIYRKKMLEQLLEASIFDRLYQCVFHNVPDSELSLYSNLYPCCGNRKIPSKTVQTLEAHTDEVWFLKFSHNGKYLASSSKDKSAIIWEMNEERKFQQKHVLLGHEKPVVMVLWSPDDKEVITCGESEVIRRWDVESGAMLLVYEINGVGSVSCGWFHDGSGVIGGMTDRRIYLWELDGTEVAHEQGQRAQKLSDVAMTSDWKWLVSVGRVHEIVLFHRETGLETLVPAEDMITSFSLSSRNNYLLINLITQKIDLWNIEGEEPFKVLEFTGHKRTRFIIRSCFGGYRESLIASGSEDSQVYIWRAKFPVEQYYVLTGHSGAVNCVSWSPNDLHMLASASDDGTIRIWGLEDAIGLIQESSISEQLSLKIGVNNLLKKSEVIRLITGAIYSLGFDEIATRLEQESGITLNSDTAKKFLKQVKDGEWDESILTLEEFHLPAKFTKMLADKSAFGCTEHDKASRTRSDVLEQLLKLFPPGVIYPEEMLEHLLEEILCRQLNCCVFHNVPDSELSLYSYHYSCGNRKIPSKIVQTMWLAHTDEVWFLEFSHNGKYLASSSKDESAIIWQVIATGMLVKKHRLLGHKKPVVMVLWSPDDKEVITCGESEVIRRWDVESGAMLLVYEISGVGSVSCGWFHDGSGVIGGMEDRRIYLWKLDGTEVAHEQGQRAQKLSDVAMTSDGKWLVSVARENEISLFDRETGVERLFQAEDMITSFSLSSNNELLINLITQKVQLWCITEEPPCMVFECTGHKRNRFIIRSCCGGYRDSFIASGSEDSQVYIWSTRQPMGLCRVLTGHSGSVNCVSWNPEKLHMLASASDDRTIRLWGLDDGTRN